MISYHSDTHKRSTTHPYIYAFTYKVLSVHNNLPREADVSGIGRLSLSSNTTFFPLNTSFDSCSAHAIVAVASVRRIGKLENFFKPPLTN